MVAEILFQVELTTLGVSRKVGRDEGNLGIETISGGGTAGSLGRHSGDDNQHAEKQQRQKQSPTRHSISAL